MRVLQIEFSRSQGYKPSTTLIPGVNVYLLENLTSVLPNVSVHANEVLTRICGNNTPAKGLVDVVDIGEATNFYNRNGLGMGKTAMGIYPKQYSTARICNISGGGTTQLYDDQLIERLDNWIVNFDILCVVAIPDQGMGYSNQMPNKLFSLSRNAILVGSNTGAHQILPGGRVDCVGGEVYTSYSAPQVTSLAIAVAALYDQAKKPWHWFDIKSDIINACDAMIDSKVYGSGVINVTRTLDNVKRKLNLIPVVPPPPTLSERKAALALSLGGSYANGIFTIPEGQVATLAAKLPTI